MARQYGSRFLIYSVLLSLILVGSAWAESPRIAGDGTVREWRAIYGGIGATNEAFAVTYAAGASAWLSIYFWCRDPGTVGELAAFLRYGAEPDWTVRQALVSYVDRRDCVWKSLEEVIQGLNPGRTPEPPPSPRPTRPAGARWPA
jgi:hypothetical protein